MVIDCQACGAQQRVDDARVAAAGGVVACRSCGAQIRTAGGTSAIEDDDATVVTANRPLSRPSAVGAPGVSSFAPIPIPGSAGPAPASTTQRTNALELGALGMSNSKSSNQFDEPTRPRLAPQSGMTDEEPIPLLEADDILDIDEEDPSDAATLPGTPLSSITRPANRSAPASVPIPVPQTSAPLPVPTPQPVPKAPSFLEELPPVPTMDQNSAPTRFNRNIYDHDDLPGIGDATTPSMSAYTPPASTPSQTASYQAPPTPASFQAPPPAASYQAPPAPASTPFEMPPSFPPADDFSATQPSGPFGDDLPAQFDQASFPADTPPLEPPAADFGDLPQWAPVEGAVVNNNQGAGGFELDTASDLPAALDLPATLDHESTPAGLPPSAAYGGTNYTASGYGSTSYNADNEPGLDLPSDFGDLPPPPDELPSIGETTQVTGEPRLELEGDLPMPSAMQGGVVLNDDLPMPTSGAGHDIALDLPAPSSFGGETPESESVPQLMDMGPVDESPPPPERRDTAIVRDKKKRDDVDQDASTEEAIATVKGKGKALRYTALAVIVIAGLFGLSIQFPEYIPFQVPWNKPDQVMVAETPAPATPATPTDAAKTATADTAKPTPPAAPPIEAPPPTPELSAANVNQLGYLQLRDATKTLAADAGAAAGAAHELLQWARFRLARYGDQEARDALLADAPQLSPTASELTAAAAIGAQLLTKPMIAKKNIERLVGGPGPANKARFKDSVAMLTVAAAANEKPPFKAIQFYDRILAIDPRAMDARVGKVEAMLLMPKPELHQQAIASAISMVKLDPTSTMLAVRLGTAAATAGESSAMMDLTAALTKVEQASEVPAGQQLQFAKLLAHRTAIAGDFATAQRAADLAMKNAPADIAAVQDLARIISASGKDPESALQEARSAVREVDGKAQLIDEQVKLALVRNDAAAAAKAQGLYADLAPRPAMPFVKLGEARIAQSEGKNDAARMAAMMAAKMRPKAFEARLIVINNSKMPPPAELVQLTALAKQANNADVDARLAKAMVDRQNPGGGAELYARALWRDPMPADPMVVVVALADALDRAGTPERAEPYFAALRNNGSTDARLGNALMAHAKRYSKGTAALDYFQEASAKNPTDIQAKLQYARALVDADRSAEAQALLDALAHTPEGKTSPEVLTELARAWVTRDAVKARELINEAIRLKPDAAKYELLGEIEESQSKLDDAMDAYRKAVKLDAASQEARVRLARAEIQRGQWQDASVQLRDIVQHDPTNVQAMELLGDSQRDVGKPRDALLWYKKALDITPDSATLMMKFARLQLQDLSAVQPAVKSFRRVLQVHPEVAEAHYYLGYALKDLGKNGEAKVELEEYLKARPDGEFATEVKNDLQDLAGQ